MIASISNHGAVGGRATRSASTLFVLLVLAIAAPQVQATTLTRGPYLQQVTNNSAMIVWQTATAVACTLGYAPPGMSPTSVVTAEGTTHVVSIDGLQTETRYEYTIRTGDLLAGGPEYYVHTAPQAGTGATHRLVVWGDSGNGNSTQMAVAAVMNQEPADLGLIVGDIIYTSGQPEYYDPRYFTPYADLIRHTPIWAVLGNHDMGNPQAYYDAWYLPTNPLDNTERFYSFDYGDLHIVALDTNKQFTTDIKNWIAADLDASTARWKMVFFHHTIYSCGSYHGSSSSLINALTPIFDAHGVDLVLYGHDHHYERSYPMFDEQVVDAAMNPDYVNPSGPIYVISGAGGSARSSSESCYHTARAISTPCYVRLEITDGLLTLEAVNTSGTVIDRMTVLKTDNPPPPPPPPATIHVATPAGGESYDIGDSVTVQWTSSTNLGNVRIDISRDGNSGPWESLVASTPDDGMWQWIVNGPTSNNCWLRVADASDGSPSDLTSSSFHIGSAPVIEPPPSPSIIGVNFQPADVPIPTAYVDDTGLLYDPGEGYGWQTVMTMEARNVLPEDPHDSFVDVVNDQPPATWEIGLANGYYRVTLMCGDPQTTATHRVAIEGQTVIEDVHTVAGQYYEALVAPVLVSDGRLSMTAGGSGDITHTKVNSILISPAQPVAHAMIAPAGGENFCTGASVPVQWSGATVGAFVRIELSRTGPGGPWESLGVARDSGSESWLATGAASSDCYFRIVDLAGTVLAQSPAPFTISEPVLTLVHPTGGEIWTVGSTRNIEWTSSCLAGDVRIDASSVGPSGPWSVLIPSTLNDGFEAYRVRREDIGWTYVRVVSLPFEIPSDFNDSPFSVVDAPPPPHTWHFDFMPVDATPAYGYEADTGLLYDAGSGHGWTSAVLMKKRDMLPNDCRDHFVQVVNNTTATWQLDVPNGQYFVSLICGDPYTSGTHRVALEGEIVVQDVYAVGGTYVVRENLSVQVQDGQLTMTLGGSGQITSTKVSCIDVEPVGIDPPPRRRRTHELSPAVDDMVLRDRLEAPGLVRGHAAFALDLTRPAPVRLVVHDVRGRIVAVLHEGEMSAGRHALSWEPRDDQGARLPSGVYFLRLDSPILHETHKMVVIR